MAWSNTAPTLPNGASWNTAKTASRTWNWYKISIEVQTARGTGSTFYVKMKVSFANGESGYSRSTDGLWWYVSGMSNSANYSMPSSAGNSQTRYWTGSDTSDSAGSKTIGVSIKESTSSSYTVNVSINLVGRIYYTITYNANGGSGTQQTRDILSGKEATLINNPYTYTGHTFNKWNTNSGGTGTAYSAGANYTPTKDVTLYATWTIITYTISYNGNGNTGGSTALQTRNHGTAAITIRSNGFTKTGYHFLHWNTNSSGTGATYNPGASYSTNANLVLYAIWALDSAPIYINIGDTIYQVNEVYLNDNGTIKTCTVYANVNGTIKQF